MAKQWAQWNGAIHDSRHRLLKAMREHLPFEVYGKVAGNANRHYLAFSLDVPGKVSYADRPADVWNAEKRVRTKLGRYLSRRLHIDIAKIQEGIEKVEGADRNGFKHEDFELTYNVREVYRRGYGPSSCMEDKGEDGPNGCLWFYEENGIPVLVWKDHARALLWTLDDGAKFLDRIYPNTGPHIEQYIRWARANKVQTRAHNKLPDGDIHPEGYITLKAIDEDTPVPYMDTWRYFNPATKRLYGSSSKIAGNYYILNNTDGENYYGEDGENGESCSNCNERYDPEDGYCGVVNGESVCASCYEESFYCEYCEENYFDCSITYATREWRYGRQVRAEQITICESCATHSGNFTDCESCNEIFENSLIVEAESPDGRYTYSLCALPDGSGCAYDNTTICEECERTIYNIEGDAMVEDDEGEMVCTYCNAERNAEREAEREANEESEATQCA